MGDAANDRLAKLAALGQSVWLDYISRSLIATGGLQRLIDQDGIAGMTSNPSIFEKAIGGGGEYSDAILELARQGHDATEIFDRLAIADVQAACDVFTPVYVGSGGQDGFVSLEVSPALARDTRRTISEARRLFAAVDRPNVMIKIPGTVEGLPAIRASLASGLNVNITLMFSMAHYEAVVEAFMSGLEDRLAAGGEVRRIASVASFFVSRVDTLVDKLLDEKLAQAGDADRVRIEACQGKLAVANSKLVYERFEQLFAAPRWQRLAAAGAKVQRVLWASTSTKNRAFSDVLYVDELIGPAYRQHAARGDAGCLQGSRRAAAHGRQRLRRGACLVAGARRSGHRRGRCHGAAAGGRRRALREVVRGGPGDRRAAPPRAAGGGRRVTPLLPEELREPVGARLRQLEQDGFARRLWERDASLWKSDAAHKKIISAALGWLGVADDMRARAAT